MPHALRLYRRSTGLSLQTLASRIGISTASLSRIETGKQTPSVPTLLKIVDETAGAVTVSDFRQQGRGEKCAA
ncbi:helix-turn-helix transcriptional regulator [Inquilinus sp.]|uniref:helix-turn-helix transcriptional regulator n=1 Tax=Inquilinus sp. TaxID=1932117 RepID=UPI003783C424